MPEIKFYKTVNGKSPVIEFLDSLTGKQAQKVVWVLELFEETHIVAKQYFKKLKNTEDIWKIRIIYSGDIFRILGFFDTSNTFVLTNGFIKKTQKTPAGEIKTAEKRKKDYYKRKNK